MAYKNPEDKKQWEREHREQRNARRRKQPWGTQMEPIVPRTVPDPIPDQELNGAWLVAAGIGACVLAVVLGVLAALGRASVSLDSGPGRPAS
jgi:hypothetical protein